MTRLSSSCQAVAEGTRAPAPGLRGLVRRVVCVLVRTHASGVPF